jgi:hypothetical protein
VPPLALALAVKGDVKDNSINKDASGNQFFWILYFIHHSNNENKIGKSSINICQYSLMEKLFRLSFIGVNRSYNFYKELQI